MFHQLIYLIRYKVEKDFEDYWENIYLFIIIIILALGPRYQPEDFDIQSIFPLESFSSGVQSKIIFKKKKYFLLFIFIKSCEY